jgi:hypothetical protein
MTQPLATHDYAPGQLEAAREFVKRTYAELRLLRKVRVWRDKLHIIDVNKDYFEVRGLGYGDPDVLPLLRMINTAYDPETIHAATTAPYKEFATGRCHPWAHDRVM